MLLQLSRRQKAAHFHLHIFVVDLYFSCVHVLNQGLQRFLWYIMNCDNLLIVGISFRESTGKHSSENETTVVIHGKIIYQLQNVGCKENVDTSGTFYGFIDVYSTTIILLYSFRILLEDLKGGYQESIPPSPQKKATKKWLTTTALLL